MDDVMDVLRRCECPTHGNTLTVADEAGRRFCVPHARYVEAIEVEYVRADAYREAVSLLREIGEMAGAKANGKDARAMAKKSRDYFNAQRETVSIPKKA